MESNAEILDAFKDIGDDVIASNFVPTLDKDKTKNRIDALHAIYKILRPGDLATDERVEELFKTTFLDEKRFDLGEIARMKIEKKLGITTKYTDEGGRFLSLEEIIKALKYFLNLRSGKD
jgi:DNA-directed RNA polymerase subunit beta